MKRAAVALRAWIADVVGIEGAFLGIGTACLAIGASFISPIAPWFVIGGTSTLIGLLLAVPRRAG